MGEFIASIYNYIYILAVAIMTFVYIPQYKLQSSLYPVSNKTREDTPIFILLIAILFIGFRPLSERYFVDMVAYAYHIRRFAWDIFELNLETDNLIFDNLLLWWGTSGLDERSFFVFMATLYFGCAYLGIKRLLPNYSKIAFLVFLAAFSTFSYSVNGLKAGVATSIFIMALGYVDKKIICAFLLLVSLGFHHSMVLPIIAFLIVFFVRNPKIYYAFWLFSLLMACLHITFFQHIFAGLTDEQGALYLTATETTTEAHIGFRPDFILYSAVPVWLGYQYEFKSSVKLTSRCRYILHFYIITNAVWLLCMYASFNNRIAYLSWFIYPIVIIFPYLDKSNNDPQRFIKLDKVIKYHLMFTLFMVIVYYGLLKLGR